jgi:hypothetical protein
VFFSQFTARLLTARDDDDDRRFYIPRVPHADISVRAVLCVRFSVVLGFIYCAELAICMQACSPSICIIISIYNSLYHVLCTWKMWHGTVTRVDYLIVSTYWSMIIISSLGMAFF